MTTKRKWYPTKAEWAAAMAAKAEAGASECLDERRHGETSRRRGRAHGMAGECLTRQARFEALARRFRERGE